ncbi:stretch-activated Ca2+-permeable channel component-domain-containing protein [Fennellomyces sp. T-0311]|nr:stretch-activated Ca2+-permeable channel component-domain-containing protein [Fennellomyces sp. T-0311]
MQSFILFILCAALAVAQQVTVPLNDSAITTAAIGSGDLQHFYFSASSNSLLDRRRLARRDVPNLFLTLTSCSQPTPPPNYEGEIPSLDVFLSTSADNTLPGPSQGLLVNDTKFGRVAWENTQPIANLWIGVVAPTLTENWNGNWTFQIAVSTEEWVHPLLVDQHNIPYMKLDDTDQTNALFLIDPHNQRNSSILIASNVPTQLSYSLCAATSFRVPDYAVNMTDTSRGLQAFVSNLTQNTQYTAYYLQSTNAISPPINIQTKQAENCRLVYNLGFCDQVAYSVAANPADSIDSIRTRYDDQARALFEPFDIAITQFNCESTKYSLVRNCTNCYDDYKRWLCGVSIPRCTDENEELAVRSVGVNESRNPWIDQTLSPGPYTELLPCIDLCYQVVQSCPPFMEFACPKGDLAALQYGYWNSSRANSLVSCNPVGLEEARLVISKAATVLIPRMFLFIPVLLLLLFCK